MKLLFAGCARDCATVLEKNISSIFLACASVPSSDVKIYLVENNSIDGTRDIIVQLAQRDPRIVPVFLDNLDLVFIVREARIAFCRDLLLNRICECNSSGLYIPFDLDLNISSALQGGGFWSACELVASSKCTAVFPSSSPFYYDVHALRAPNWCTTSCSRDVQEFITDWALWSLYLHIRYVVLKQKPHLCLRRRKLIPVGSAFGGIGIYSLDAILKAKAHYTSQDLQIERLRLCEHVVFNSALNGLYIFSCWVIQAPSEHIEFSLLPFYRKAWRLICAAFSDLKRFSHLISFVR